MEKKIATSLEVLIKVAQYESIRLTKYGEAKIEYDSPEERMEKEERLSDEVVLDMLETMRALPDKLGKKTNSVIEIEEKIRKRIPEWLDKGPEPNIADTAKKSCEKSEAEAHAENEDRKEKAESKTAVETDSTVTELDELFGDTEATKEEATKEGTIVEEKPEEKAEEDFDDEVLLHNLILEDAENCIIDDRLT